jgi:methionyl-tRNA synthetase
VWFDALINYLAAIGFPDDMARFSRYWPADLHVIGKDITRFHCVLWPAMLMSAEIELPKSIFGHGFVNFRGERFSKTLGNIISPLDVVKKYGADPLRYFMTREIVWGRDGDFSWEQFINRYNSELANDLGNLVSRATNMLKQYFDGSIPDEAERAATDGQMKASLTRTRDAYYEAMDGLEIHAGLAEVFSVVRDANRYIEEKSPWALVKRPGGKKEAAAVLFDVAEVLRNTAVLLFPFMPGKSQEIWAALGIREEIALADFAATLGWRASWRGLSGKIGDLRSLFPRIETEKGAAPGADSGAAGTPSGNQSSREKPMEPENPSTPDTGAAPSSSVPESALIDITEFKRLDLRVAHVKSASAVPGAKKLLKLFIDIGGEERQIVAGIAEHYAPEDLTGKSIIVITNLKPATIRGIESRGMLLAASDGSKVIVLTPDRPAGPGSKIS